MQAPIVWFFASPSGSLTRNGPFLVTGLCGGKLPTMFTHLVRALRAQAAPRAVRHIVTSTPHATKVTPLRGTAHLRAESCTHLPTTRTPTAASRTFATAADPAQDRAALAQLRRTYPANTRSCSAVQAVPCPPRCRRVHRYPPAEHSGGRRRPRDRGTSIPRSVFVH